MILKYVICLLLIKHVAAQVLYDTYFGKPITEERNNSLIQLNATSPCIIPVQPCRKYEGRRTDGTCVNPKYPSRNGSPTPFLRMLPAQFGMDNSLRPMMNGSELPSARLIRTKILTEGYRTDHHFNMMATNMLLHSLGDTIDLRYVARYVLVSECCIGNTPNRASRDCIAIPVPSDDPFLRSTGVRCMNLTRFQTFQDYQCIPRTLPAERVSLQTPLLDMSDLYGFTEERVRSIRSFQGGLLKSEMRDGIERPPADAVECFGNRRPRENACYQFAQLNEIRKTSTARLMCDSAVGVTRIQPQALLNIDKYNKIVDCKEIPGVDLRKWRDPKCHENDKYYDDKENYGSYPE